MIRSKNAGKGSFGTNGTLLNNDRVKKLLDAGLQDIYVSIDTLDPDVYKATRGGKLSKVIKNVQDMIETVPSDFQIEIALMDHKDHRITEKVIEHFHETFGRRDNVKVSLIENMLFPSAPEDYRVGYAKTDNCFSPANYVFIALDGSVAVCCMDQDVLHSLGSVKDSTIHDIWFDEENQTTFRNIALGIGRCPDVCTNRCVLNTPKLFVSKIGVGYVISVDAATELAQTYIQKGEKQHALSTLRAICHRDPKNYVVRGKFEELAYSMNVRPEEMLRQTSD